MTRFEAWLSHLSLALLAASGVIVAVCKYLLPAPQDFSVVAHPLQAPSLHAHVLAAPFAVFALGLLARAHVYPKLRLRRPEGRTSGLTLAWSSAPMILSGYLLQVVTSEWGRDALVVVHLASSAVFVAAYAAHQLVKRRAAERARLMPAPRPDTALEDLPLS